MGLRIVIAEDSLLMREGINAVLALEDDIEIVAECWDYDGLLAAVEEHDPDIVVTDIRMPPTQTDEGIRVCGGHPRLGPGIGIVVLSQFIEPTYALRLFDHGSDGTAYLLKERVRRPVRARVGDPNGCRWWVRRGRESCRCACSSPNGARVDSRPADRPRTRGPRRGRQRPEQRRDPEALFISARSVEKHINSIFTKLDLSFEDNTNREVRRPRLPDGDQDLRSC